jgi:hypothetical protein
MSELKEQKTFFKGLFKEKDLSEQEKKTKAEEAIKGLTFMYVFCCILFIGFFINTLYYIDPLEIQESITSSLIAIMFLIFALSSALLEAQLRSHWRLRDLINENKTGA